MVSYFDIDFEAGNLSEVDGIVEVNGGDVTASGTHPNGGSWGLSAFVDNQNNSIAQAYKSVGSHVTTLFSRFYFYVTVLPAAGTDSIKIVHFRDMQDFENRMIVTLGHDGATGVYAYTSGTGAVLTKGSTLLSANHMYLGEARLLLGNGTGAMSFYVDENEEAIQSNLINDHTVRDVYVGGNEGNFISVYETTVYMDDWAAASTYIGPAAAPPAGSPAQGSGSLLTHLLNGRFWNRLDMPRLKLAQNRIPAFKPRTLFA